MQNRWRVLSSVHRSRQTGWGAGGQWPDQTGSDSPDSSLTCLSHAAARRQAEMDMAHIEISGGTAQNGKDYSRISKCLWQLNIFCYGLSDTTGRGSVSAPHSWACLSFCPLFRLPLPLKWDPGERVKYFTLPVPTSMWVFITKWKYPLLP